MTQSESNWEWVLRKVFGDIGVVLVTQLSQQKGAWKLGKTDVSLLLAEYCLKYKLVTQVASNINTFGHFPQVSDLVSLRRWLFGDNRTKLYLFDEMNKHVPSRRAMSNKNVGVIQIFPEISKARARLICVGQDLLTVDKQIVRDIWVRGLFVKKQINRVEVISDLFEDVYPFTVPKTSVPFDPYEIAPFTETPERPTLQFKDKSLYMLHDYAEKTKHKTTICNENDISREQFDRILRSYLQKTLPMFEKLDVTTDDETVIACTLYRNGGTLVDIQKSLNLNHVEEAKRILIKGIDTLLKNNNKQHLIAQPSLLKQPY